jgi:hypothetical protein
MGFFSTGQKFYTPEQEKYLARYRKRNGIPWDDEGLEKLRKRFCKRFPGTKRTGNALRNKMLRLTGSTKTIREPAIKRAKDPFRNTGKLLGCS